MDKAQAQLHQADTAMGELKRRTLSIAFTYTLSFFENLAKLSYP